MKNKENQKTTATVDRYKEKIVDMVNRINDVWLLKAIHNFVVGMTKEEKEGD